MEIEGLRRTGFRSVVLKVVTCCIGTMIFLTTSCFNSSNPQISSGPIVMSSGFTTLAASMTSYSLSSMSLPSRFFIRATFFLAAS